MSEPKHNKGRSKQDYETPESFMRAVESRFGSLSWDLAASVLNHKAPKWIDEVQDSLTAHWHLLNGLLWLNPPFGNIAPWAEKCLIESQQGARILFLTPASVGSNWFRDFIHKRARVIFLNGRITFVGASDPYPKDCMLTIFGDHVDFEIWTWPLESKKLLAVA